MCVNGPTPPETPGNPAETTDLDDVLGTASTTVRLIQSIPWTWLIKRAQVFFAVRISLVGPENSGKTTLKRVLYNQGNLVRITEHKRSQTFDPGKAMFVAFEGDLGRRERIFRNIFDTPGQRHDTAVEVAQHIEDSRTSVLVFVIDCSRPFEESAEQSERDSSKWFDDLIDHASQVRNEGFRTALAQVKVIVVLLNKADKVYDDIAATNDYKPEKIPEAVEERLAPLKKQVFAKIRSLMVQGGRKLSESEVAMFPACLVKHEGKRVQLYDKAHMKMLVEIHEDLGARNA